MTPHTAASADDTSLSAQTAAGKVVMHFCISLDGFVAGPEHDMSYMQRATAREGLIREHIPTVGAVLAGRAGFDSAIGDSRPYGGAWKGPIFVLTHHPDDARPAEDVTFLSGPVEEAVQIALEAARGLDVEIFSPTIGAQLLERGMIDELKIHIAPVLLGDGIRLYEAHGGRLVHLLRDAPEPTQTVDLRYRVAPEASE